jgi:FkbM family methyltransferase
VRTINTTDITVSTTVESKREMLSTLISFNREIRASLRLCDRWRSRLRLMSDFLLSHGLFAIPRRFVNRERQITTRSGVMLSYRLNRGDLQGIREVWIDEAYRLPFAPPSGALLDLGANIGLTSVWLATQIGFDRVICVEPDHDNASLAAKNLKQNQLAGTVIEAAIGPADGTVFFSKASWSNLGHVADDGIPVRLVRVDSILKQFGLDDVGLTKVDIEGGEQALFLGPSAWLHHTKALIVEFHPPHVDCALLIQKVASQGFEYIPASVRNMDCFIRNSVVRDGHPAPPN